MGIDDAVAISAGQMHACALLKGGTVKCWGVNGSHQLGSNGPPYYSGTPIPIAGVQGATAIASGAAFSCALSGGAVNCWGSNYLDALGSGKTAAELPSTAAPVPVAGVTTAVSLAAGASHGCVVLANGSVQCWGSDSFGETGTLGLSGQAVPSPSPIPGISGPAALTVGSSHICGLLPDGTINCWGSNSSWQLGYGNSVSRSATALAVAGISGATALAAGQLGTCAVGADGLVRCWGFGALGIGQTRTVTSSVPAVVMGLVDAKRVSANLDAGCAVRSEGSVLCWGNDIYGVLGNGGSNAFAGSAVPVTAPW